MTSKLLESAVFLMGYLAAPHFPRLRTGAQITAWEWLHSLLNESWGQMQKLSVLQTGQAGFGTMAYKEHDLRNTWVGKSSLVRGNKCFQQTRSQMSLESNAGNVILLTCSG